MSKAFREAFQRGVQRFRPWPVGSRLMTAMQTHFRGRFVRRALVPSVMAPSSQPRPSDRSTVPRSAVRTPNANETRPGTKTGRAGSEEQHGRFQPPPHPWPISRQPPKRLAAPPRDTRRSETRSNPPRPGTAHTASSPSPSLRSWRHQKPPGLRCPPAFPMSSRSAGLRDSKIIWSAARKSGCRPQAVTAESGPWSS